VSAAPAPLARVADAPVALATATPVDGLAPVARVGRVALVALAACVFGGLALLKHRNYLYDDIDFAIFAQAVDRLLHGSTWVSIRGMSWLGDHASYVLALLAPAYAVVRRPETLLVAQALALAAAVVPVHRLARRALGLDRGRTPGATVPRAGEWAALAFAAAWLAQPALAHLALYEFHPEVFATAALLFAFDAVERDRARACVAWVALALLAREDVALVGLAFGAWALVARRPRAAGAGLAVAALSLAALAVTMLAVRPRFASDAAQYGAMYRALGDSPAAVAATLLRAPWRAAALLFATPGDAADAALKAGTWCALLAPLAALPLLAPAALLVAAPVLAEHLLSARWQQHVIVFHYAALLLPVLAWAGARGLARLAGVAPRAARMAAFGALAASLAAQAALGPFAAHPPRFARPLERAWPAARDAREAPLRGALLARVPAGGAVIAGPEFLSRLAARDDVHSLHHVLGGRFTYSTRAYPEPERVTAVLADWSAPRLLPYVDAAAGRRIARVLARNGLAPVAATGDLVLFARGAAPPLVTRAPAWDALPARARFDGALEFLGAQVAARPAADGTIALVTAWRRVAPLDATLLERLELVDAQGRVVDAHTRVLGYVVSPVADWPAGAALAERYALFPGVDLAPGSYHVRLRLARLGATTPVHIEPALAALDLGAFEVPEAR